ncbi:MAG: hypothetical protein VX667_06535 [Nitrospinota bacterium]|nr:hypothetical protein [Nitrospinota bacterium]
MSKKSLFLLGSIFYLAFLLLTPLGVFNDWIPPLSHTGYYSVTTVDGGDDTGYYSYLRSAFFDGDLDFIDERHYAHSERFNDTGYVFNNWQLGQGILYLPFFLIAHFLAKLYGAMGYPVASDGYSVPYYMGTAIATGTYLFLGLLLVIEILKKFFSGRVAWVASLAIWLGSPILYYTFIRSRMAHATEFSLAALFILVWLHYRESEKISHHALIGACLGFLCLVRLINICFLVLYAGDILVRWMSNRQRFLEGGWRDDFWRAACFSGMFLVLMLPQFYAWNQLNGFIISPYLLKTAAGQTQSASLMVTLEKGYKIFLSPQWGLVFAAPLWFLGLGGLFMKRDFPKDIRLPALLSVAGLLVILLSFIESDAYGNRYFIPAGVLCALGLGALLQICERSKPAWRSAIIFVFACVLAQYFMIAQYKVTLPYNHSEFTLKALSAVPTLLSEYPEKLLRSTNLIYLLSLDRNAPWDYRDILFLVLFPLGQLASVLIIAAGYFYFTGKENLPAWASDPKKVLAGITATSLLLCGAVGFTAPSMYEEAIESRQNYKKLLGEGGGLLSQGRVEEAREKFVKASNLMPRLWNPNYKIGVTWSIRQNLEEANKYYEKVLKVYPNHPYALFGYGNNLKMAGKWVESEQMLKSAIRAWPLNKQAYDALGQVYVSRGKLKDALEMLNNSVMIDPAYGPGHANLAVVYTMMKEEARAVNHLNIALRLGVKGPAIDNLVALYSPKPANASQ